MKPAMIKAAFVTLVAWFVLMISRQLLRGLPVIPSNMDLSGYLIMNLSIGLLLGGTVAAVTGLILTLSGVKK